MFEIYGDNYIIDFDVLENHSLIREHISQGDSKIRRDKVNSVKVEIINILLNRIIFSEVIDEKLGFRGSDGSVGFKIAFNTLLNYKIIKPYE